MSFCPVSSPQKSQTTQTQMHEDEAVAVWDCGSPLYDSYELVSLTHHIERHLMALPTDLGLGGSKRHLTKLYYPYDAHVSSNVVGSNISDHRGPSSSSSSKVGTLSEFVASRLWKKKVIGHIINDKRKSSKFGVCCGFSYRFGFWKNY